MFLTFQVILNAQVAAVTGDGNTADIPFNQVIWMEQSCYNLALNYFVVPEHGNYLFLSGLCLSAGPFSPYDTLDWRLTNTTTSEVAQFSILNPSNLALISGIGLDELQLTGSISFPSVFLQRGDVITNTINVSGGAFRAVNVEGSSTKAKTYLSCYRI
jgi:hypothetical protein